jgi:hypothetical protein
MTKHYRYLRTLTVISALLGLAVASWAGSRQQAEPNAPLEDRELTASAKINEPNSPAKDRKSNNSEESRQASGPLIPWDNYRIVVEQNVFSRNRGPRAERTRRQVPVAPPAPDPESYVVLKGIVQEGGEFIAFLEDTQSGRILRVRKGDSIMNGKVKSLTLDSLEYEVGDRTTVVTMGLNLQGGSDGTTFTGMYDLTQMSATAPAEGTTQSQSIPAEGEAEILRQLMERRQQQIGK